MSPKRVAIIGTISLLCLFGLGALERSAPHVWLRVNNAVRDAVTRVARTAPANPDLVFLAIDSASVGIEEDADIQQLFGLGESESTEARTLRLISQRWPWPREVYARVLERLVEAGARAVIFDLTFPSATADDEPFRLALERYRAHAVIGSNFVNAGDSDSGSLPSHTRPAETLVPQTTPMDDRVAFTNFWPDEDDVVRAAQYRVTRAQIENRYLVPGDETFFSLAARGLLKAGLGDRVPTGLEARRFRFTAPPRQGFPPHSLFGIFAPEYWQRLYRSGEFFRGKIVLVGAEGNWQHDEHPTPFGTMPGPEVHLNAMNAAIHGEFITDAPAAAVVFSAVFMAVLGTLLTIALRSPWLRLGVLLGVWLLGLWGVVLLLDHLDVYLPALPALAQLTLTLGFGLICDFTWERMEKARVRRALERYVSTNVVRELLDNPSPFQQALGGVMKPVAILFSDLRGYSSLGARTDPQQLISQLNEYLGAMVECVFRHGGTLDKFVGDAVMAVWGNVQSDGARADTASSVRAALEMRSELARLNRDWAARGLPLLKAGIAVNQGEVVVGNIGSPQRMEFTVIGDAVNACWKLQEMTKHLGADLIISAHVATLVSEEFELEPLGCVDVPGLAGARELFAVRGPIEPNPARLTSLPAAPAAAAFVAK